jgi:MazG family protein
VSREAEAVGRLFELMERLRGPGGCPWDAAQTPKSLLPYLLEEAYELADAILASDAQAVREELGDLLVEVAMQAAIAAEGGAFDLTEVADGAAAKMISRHPHVFADQAAADEPELIRNWDRMKRREKPERTSALDGIPASLPALMRAVLIQRRAARGVPGAGGFGPREETLAAMGDGLSSLEPGTSDAGLVAGELLWQVVAECQRVGVDPEVALRGAADRHAEHYRAAEGSPPGDREGPSPEAS